MVPDALHRERAPGHAFDRALHGITTHTQPVLEQLLRESELSPGLSPLGPLSMKYSVQGFAADLDVRRHRPCSCRCRQHPAASLQPVLPLWLVVRMSCLPLAALRSQPPTGRPCRASAVQGILLTATHEQTLLDRSAFDDSRTIVTSDRARHARTRRRSERPVARDARDPRPPAGGGQGSATTLTPVQRVRGAHGAPRTLDMTRSRSVRPDSQRLSAVGQIRTTRTDHGTTGPAGALDRVPSHRPARVVVSGEQQRTLCPDPVQPPQE